MARRALRFMGWKFLACVLLGWVQLGHAHAQDATTGLQIISDRAKGNCVACHALPAQSSSSGGITSTLGPTLAGIANRFNALQLRQWVTDARQIKPDTLMPPFGSTAGLNLPQPAIAVLTPEQIEHVVAALQTWR